MNGMQDACSTEYSQLHCVQMAFKVKNKTAECAGPGFGHSVLKAVPLFSE